MTFDFTICIPTYNRGKRALELVNILLKNLQKNWSILVLNNASTNGVEFYNEIENLSKINTQVEYVKHETNRQFYGNFKSCLTQPSSKYIMIISDEDFVNFDEIKSILDEIEQYENLGVCRPSVAPHKDLEISGNSHIRNTEYYKSGEEALCGYCFTNNYISGVIYNLQNIKKTNLLEVLDKNILSHKAYPHLYFDLLVSSKFDVFVTSKVSVLEGISVLSETLNEEGKKAITFDHIGLYGYGERVNQFLSFRDGIVDAIELIGLEHDYEKVNLFITLFIRLTLKYFFLIFEANINNYTSNNMEPKLLMESFFYLVCSSVIGHPYIGTNQELVSDQLIRIYQSHKELLV